MRYLALLFFVAALFGIVQLVRHRQLKEKYAILWIVLSLGTIVLLVFPGILFWASDLVGVQVPANLLFSITLALLAAVSVHLSWEASRSEERIRRLAEEVALLRLRLDERVGHGGGPTARSEDAAPSGAVNRADQSRPADEAHEDDDERTTF
jgi:hypothetical protein